MRMYQQAHAHDNHMELARARLAQQNIPRPIWPDLINFPESACRCPAIEAFQTAAAQPIIDRRIDATPDPIEGCNQYPDTIQSGGGVSAVETESATDQPLRRLCQTG